MSSKVANLIGAIVGIATLLGAVVAAHADMTSRVSATESEARALRDDVDTNSDRIAALEAKADDILWNVARLCQAQGIEGCRSARH